MNILGLGGIGHNAAAAIARDGQLLAAAEQKKIVRIATGAGLPVEAINSVLKLAAIEDDAIHIVALARPFPLETAIHLAIRERFPKARVVVVEHHTAHAAAAYLFSPFDNATVLTLDNGADFRCGARWKASGTQIQLDRELYVPDSLGALYSRVTEYLGFHAGSDEQKVQWLSTNGAPVIAAHFRNAFPLDGDWIAHGAVPSLDPLRGLGPADIAASVQAALEEVVLHLAGSGENLCLGGGVFSNALLVAHLERSGRYKCVHVNPAAGNAGTALGALAYAWHHTLGETRRMTMGNGCLGPESDAEDIKRVFENCKLRFKRFLTAGEVLDTAIDQLRRDRIVAWMQGRMEFGSRALGNRSILASPANPYSTENLNVFIKHREPYRKFAASVPAELAGEYFEVGANARYLATVGRVRDAHREKFANAIMGDGLVRVHTVDEADNPLLWRLLHKAAPAFGMPVLLNTSFNLFGDPLVCTPRDAVRSFYSSGIDALFAGQFFVEK
jgi:carbamoyltransferase